MVSREDAERMRFGGREPGQQVAVDEQTPHLSERDRTDDLFDIDSAIAERATFAIGLGDLRGEGDYALEARLNFGGNAHEASAELGTS
jgi:hypothetical protein